MATNMYLDAIRRISRALEGPFVTIGEFLVDFSEFRPTRVSRASYGTRTYAEDLAAAFVRGRNPIAPEPPSTVPDPLVSLILNKYFGIPKSQLDRAKEEHKLAMASEGIVGVLLERYIASEIEPMGWVWCSGEVVKSIDFIRKVGGSWQMLQVKNRDNSENSSSAAVRRGTSIEKWHRTKSRTGATRWDEFPDPKCRRKLSEEGFHRFTSDYLTRLTSLSRT